MISSIDRITISEPAITSLIRENIGTGNIAESRLVPMFPESNWIWKKIGRQVILVDKDAPQVRLTLDKLSLLKAVSPSIFARPIMVSSLPAGARRTLTRNLASYFFADPDEKADFGVRLSLRLQWDSHSPKGANMGTLEYPSSTQVERTKNRMFLEEHAVPVDPKKAQSSARSSLVAQDGVASYHYTATSSFERARKSAWAIQQFGELLDELGAEIKAEIDRIQRDSKEFLPSSGLLSELPTDLRGIIEPILLKEYASQGYRSEAELRADLAKINVVLSARLNIQIAIIDGEQKPNVVNLAL